MQPHVRAEHAHLQPAQIQFRRRLLRAVEAADVGGMIRTAAHAPGKRAADARREAFPIALRLAAPLDRIALAACPTRPAPYDHGLPVGRRELPRGVVNATVVEQRIDVVQPRTAIAVERDRVVGHVLAEITRDDIDAGLEQRFVRVAPPGIRIGMGEIEDARWRQRCQHAGERRRGRCRVPFENVGIAARRIEQEALLCQLAE